MKKLNIYLLKEFLSFFFGALILFVILITVAEISSRLSTYTQNMHNIKYFLSYHIFKMPFYTYYIFPIALMFSSTYVLGTFVKNKEMIAIENSGISLFKFSTPIFIIVIFLCTSLVFFWEFVAAPLNKKAFDINDFIKGKGEREFSGDWTLFGADNYVYFLEAYSYKDKYMINAIILKLRDDGGIEMRISSPKIQWVQEEDKWYVTKGTLTKFTENKEISVEKITNYPLDVKEKERHFIPTPPLDSMSLSYEYKFIKLRKEINMATLKYETDFHYRISYCFSGFIIVMLASLFSKFSTQSVLVVSLVLVILVALFYYSVVMIFRSMGEAGNINAFIAAWVPNIIFSIFCILAFKKFH